MSRLLIFISFLISSITASYAGDYRCISNAGQHIKFVANKLQWEPQILFRADLSFGTLFLESDCFTYVLTDQQTTNHCRHESLQIPGTVSKNDSIQMRCHAVKMHFEGSKNDTKVFGRQCLPEYQNFFLGNDTGKWAGQVPVYKGITYQDLYPGIDLCLGSQNLDLKYEFVLQPFADPQKIKLRYEGADTIFIHNGNLCVGTSIVQITERKPLAYQILGKDTIIVTCNYRIVDGQISFEFPEGYRRNCKLVIDPVVVASTYAGTLAMYTYGHCAAYDNEGNIYAGGRSFSQGYPTTTGAYMTMYNGGFHDVVISKFNPTGTTLMWATYLGGSNIDLVQSMVTNAAGELFVYGSTNSTNFPVSSNCFQGLNHGGYDIFVTHFNAGCTGLMGSTLIGGSSDDGQNQVAHNYGDELRGEIIIDQNGNPSIASFTHSADFPVSSNAFSTAPGGMQDAVVCRFNNDLSGLTASTYLGGMSIDAAYCIREGASGDVYVGGGTGSADFPVTPGCIQTVYSGNSYEGFVTRFSSDLSTIISSTYFGTPQFDEIFFIDLDTDNEVYVFGQSEGNFTITPGCYGNNDSRQFIAKFNPGLQNIVFQTQFGSVGTGNSISPTAFMVDICENIYAAGWGQTDFYPVTLNAIQPTTDGDDFYLIVLEKDATSLLYATFYGAVDASEHVDGGMSRFDKRGIIYEAVCESMPTFPVTPNAYADTLLVTYDMAVFKIDFQLNGPFSIIGVNPGDTGCVPYPVTFTNNSVNSVSYLWDFGDGSPSSTIPAPSHIFTQAGVYHVNCIAIDSNSCTISDTSTITIVVNGGFYVNLGSDTTLCVKDSILLNGGTPGSHYIWNTGDTTQIINVMLSGNYWVQVENSNCIGSDTVNLNLIPIPKIELGVDLYLCFGDSLLLNSGHNWLSHYWSTGAQSAFIHVFDSGLYSVAVDSAGCTGHDSVYVHLIKLESAIPYDTIICHGDSAWFDAGPAELHYLWSTGDTTKNVIISLPGTYWLLMSDSFCSIIDTFSIHNPDNLVLPETMDLCGKDKLMIGSNVVADSYFWSNGDSGPTISIYQPGTYSLEINVKGCTQNDSVVVTGLQGYPELSFPNVITPNQDGKNDSFKGSGLEITDFRLSIFNRWGKIIFTTTDPDEGWNGKTHETQVSEGVYYFLASYKTVCSRNQTIEQSGSVTILR